MSSGMDGVAPGYGASGPVPHSRWVAATVNSDMNAYNDRDDGHYTIPDTFWRFDLTAAAGGRSALQSMDQHLIDDDNVGGVTQDGTQFCVELSSGSSLEVWASVLKPAYATPMRRRWAVALLNRSPSSDRITLDFALLPDSSRGTFYSSTSSRYQVRDIWANRTHSLTADRTYRTLVAAHDTALLVVTEA
jgi:hypothetical protein